MFPKEYNYDAMSNGSNIELMTTIEVSETLGYTVQHIRLLIRQGRLKGSKIGRDWMILRESVVDYLTRQNMAPLIPTPRRGRPPIGE